ncbi:hypothetical protein GJ496_011794 [Pomphorhynchus laevis]|nr:hypothetical protein GJ496_011794 [Pomphorhynchus laevis]
MQNGYNQNITTKNNELPSHHYTLYDVDYNIKDEFTSPHEDGIFNLNRLRHYLTKINKNHCVVFDNILTINSQSTATRIISTNAFIHTEHTSEHSIQELIFIWPNNSFTGSNASTNFFILEIDKIYNAVIANATRYGIGFANSRAFSCLVFQFNK